MNRIFSKGRAVAVAAALAVVIGQPASAGQFDFDDEPASTGWTKMKTVPFDGGSITGGQVLALTDNNVYATHKSGKGCTGCGAWVRVDFVESVANVTLTLVNSSGGKRTYNIKVNDVLDHQVSIKSGASAAVEILEQGIDSVRINPTKGSMFYVDDIAFKSSTGTKVSFRAFIPGDNVPAAQSVFCVALPEMTVDGMTKAPTVVRGTNASVDSPAQRGIVVAGAGAMNNQDHKIPISQSVTVVPNAAEEDATAVNDSIENNVVDLLAFSDDALSGGDEIASPAWTDWALGDGGDCRWYHKTEALSDGNMNVEPGRVDPTSVSVRFSGSVDTPLGGPAGNDEIDWDLTVTLDTADNWTVYGAHDGFPAYEIYIGAERVYASSPGDGPYTFNADVRSQLKSMSVQVNEWGTMQ